MHARTFVTLVPLLVLACSGTKAPGYITEAASIGTVRDVITATGQIEARTKVNVGSQISGTLQRVAVSWNDVVRRGDVLAEIDPRLYAAQLARAQASVQVAQANVAKAQVDVHDKGRVLRRFAGLRQQNLVAQAELESAEVAHDGADAALAGARAALTQAQADRDLARANLTFTKIVSPIDGVVLDRQVDAGQTVAAQFQVATLFVIAADMHEVQVVVSVDEADVGKLVAPLPASFRVAAYPERTFAGTVAEVRPAPTASGATGSSTQASSAVVTYAAVVRAENPEGALRQGMTAELTAVVAEAKDAVRVPTAALRWAPAGKTPDANVLWTLVGGKAVARAVRLGLSDGQFVVVQEGLAAGEAVVVGDDGAGSRKGPRRGLL